MNLQPEPIPRGNARFPARLHERLSADTPPELTARGNFDLLALPKTALFCSARCPGNLILRTYDQAAQWRDAGRCVISGFHSPVERECLQILLRGDGPVILCPARGMLERPPAQWDIAVASGRMLLLSGFPTAARRVTTKFAARRNAFVAALADEVFIVHATPGGHLETLARRLHIWSIPLTQPYYSIGRSAGFPPAQDVRTTSRSAWMIA